MANPTSAKTIACFVACALVAAALHEEECNEESCPTKGPALLQGAASKQTNLLSGDGPTEGTLDDEAIAKLSKSGHPFLAELASNVSVEFSCSDQSGSCSGLEQFCAHSSPNKWVKNNCQGLCNCCDNPQHLSLCSEHANFCDPTDTSGKPSNPTMSLYYAYAHKYVKDNCCLTCSFVAKSPGSSPRRRGTNFVGDIKKCSERQGSSDECEKGDDCCRWHQTFTYKGCKGKQHDTLDGSSGEVACLNGQGVRR